MSKKQKFYTVWKGRNPGVYPSWEECSAQINGFPGAEYKAFETHQAAAEALSGQYADYKGKPGRQVDRQRILEAGQPIVDSWCVDAACNPVPGRLEYRGVHTRTGEVIFEGGPFEEGTNNIGEFLAIVDALAECQKRGLTHPIYSDSQIAIIWIMHKQCKTTLEQSAKNQNIFEHIEWAEHWLQDNEYSNHILKWETDVWGENPADYGRK